MNIQTISIVVPTKGCVNKCPFCVSRMHDSPYENDWDEFQIKKRIKYAVMNGVNTCIITGTGEALQNTNFLHKLRKLFEEMNHPFPNIEIQTTGVLLSEKKILWIGEKSHQKVPVEYFYPYIDLLKALGVNTISLSVADIFEDINNLKIIGVAKNLEFYLNELIPLLKERGFNIRLSLNMLKKYDIFTFDEIIGRCKFLGANQVTFRKMYIDKNIKSPESEWVIKNACHEKTLLRIKHDIEGNKVIESRGKFLYKLPFGGKVYSINGMSIVIDDDCMSKENNETLKYIILRENGKLYCQWDNEGSLIF